MAHISDFPLFPTNAGTPFAEGLGKRFGAWLSMRFKSLTKARASSTGEQWNPETELMVAPPPSAMMRLASQHPAFTMFKR